MVLKRTFVHTYVGGRKTDLPQEVGSTPEGKVNATAQNAGFLLKWASRRASRYLSYAPPAYEYGTRPFLRWVLSQGRSPTRQAVPKMPRTPSAFPFSGRLRRRAINPTPRRGLKPGGTAPWGQRWCIQWWNTPERTVRLATTAGRRRPTTGHKASEELAVIYPTPHQRTNVAQGRF